MCFCPMKMLGTVRWPEISWRAAWMASPSSVGYHVSYVPAWHSHGHSRDEMVFVFCMMQSAYRVKGKGKMTTKWGKMVIDSRTER